MPRVSTQPAEPAALPGGVAEPDAGRAGEVQVRAAASGADGVGVARERLAGALGQDGEHVGAVARSRRAPPSAAAPSRRAWAGRGRPPAARTVHRRRRRRRGGWTRRGGCGPGRWSRAPPSRCVRRGTRGRCGCSGRRCGRGTPAACRPAAAGGRASRGRRRRARRPAAGRCTGRLRGVAAGRRLAAVDQAGGGPLGEERGGGAAGDAGRRRRARSTVTGPPSRSTRAAQARARSSAGPAGTVTFRVGRPAVGRRGGCGGSWCLLGLFRAWRGGGR